MIDLGIIKFIMVLIGMSSIFYALFKLWNKMGKSTLSLFKWFLYGLGTLALVWGLYNLIGAQLKLWEPLTLDNFFNMIFEKLGIKPFIDTLNRWLGGE